MVYLDLADGPLFQGDQLTLSGLKNPFRLRSTARRRVLLAALAVYVALVALRTWLELDGDWWRWSRLAAALTIVALAALLATMVRRLHDIGRPGGWVLLGLIPYVNIGLVLALLVWPPASRKRNESGLGTVLGVAGLAVLGLMAVLRLFLQPYWIPSEQMKPALLVGDFVMVRYLAAEDVVRGDVIVFRHSVSGRDFIMRAVGLPGDTVQMKDGRLWLNGAEVPQEANGTFTEVMGPQGPMHIRPRCENGPVGDGGQCRRSRLTETLPAEGYDGGRKYDVLNIDASSYADNTDLFTVPEGAFFVMGDNRDNSNDSRFSRGVGGVGMVEADNIIGRASFVLFSSAGERIWTPWTWRMDRLLEGVE